ncbi:retrovirus-related pol polyprotein from transposon tnt 1-94 [Lasius niger]|uniref:Retrovirus-related pol polyprotein from transposon tnt 1-94 n=1 Tax=Lasius niger TaxID=67767 RepID=A0A0J7KDV5_LASNI|nr:retrovirus-related pol polyprotein from transposon tnt 1-94 [Lasius niger]
MAYASIVNSTRIEMLNRNNYDTWSIQVEALLIKSDLWEYASGRKVKPEVRQGDQQAAQQAALDAWIAQDRKAKSDLILAISPSELTQVRGCETSREIWTKLENIYASKGPARKANLLKQLILQKLPDNGDVREHLSHFFDIVDKLSAMNIEINGDLLTIMLLYSLPDSFENFRCAIETRDTLPDAESLKVKILEENDARVRKSSQLEPNAMYVRSNSKGKPPNKGKTETSDTKANKKKVTYKCNYCQKKGHKESECFTKKKDKENKSSKDQNANHVDESFFINSPKAEAGRRIWCIDSGCTTHLCKDKDSFSRYEDADSEIRLADATTTDVHAKGTVEVSIQCGEDNKRINLENTLYVPELRTNLMSVAKIVDKNHEVVFKKNHAIIRDLQGNVKMFAERQGNLFYIQEHQQEAYATVNKKNKVELWHGRFGHLNFRDLHTMKKNLDVIGMDFKDLNTTPDCKTCLTAKSPRQPFPKRENRSSEKLQIIHTDLCGPMRTTSNGGAKYFMTITDDYSRWGDVYFLKGKDEVPSKMIEFIEKAERQTGSKVKAVQSDNGTEFCNRKLDEYFEKKGILRRLTVPNTPQQNGVAERRNRTLVESARCMLTQANLPNSFWAEAINTANYIRNRCISKSLDAGTPYEIWSGKKPNVKHLRIFGCKVFVTDTTPGKGKFQPRAKEGIFVGYSSESKAYRVWIPTERRIHISRDVRFLDEISDAHCDCIAGSENFDDDDDANTHTLDINLDRDTAIIGNNTERENNVDESDDEGPDTPQANEPRRAPGRPKLIRTGHPGRPRKQYTTVVNKATQRQSSSTNRDVTSEGAIEVSDDEWYEASSNMCTAEIPFAQAMSGDNREQWKNAIYEEMKCLVEHDTWDIVKKPPDAKVIGSRIVLRDKYGADGQLERRKARLVARGFSQRPGVDFRDTFAPVARLGSFRLLLALSVKFGLTISQLDVTTAYLNSEIDAEIYMTKPSLLDEMLQRMIVEEPDTSIAAKAKKMLSDVKGEDQVCRLNRAIYGLKQAGRQWYNQLNEVLRSIGLYHTKSDPCVFVDNAETTPTIVMVYVDDIIIASSNPGRVNMIKTELSRRFKIKDLGRAKYCLGFEIRQDGNKIKLSQTGYTREILNRFGMTDCKPTYTPLAVNSKLSKGEKSLDAEVPYRELTGALMYLAMGTRPDIAHAVSVLCQFNDCFDKSHWSAAKRVLRYLKGTENFGITYTKKPDDLTGYVDADWGGSIDDRRSFTELTFVLSGAAISWTSRKQRTVALSSTEAEYLGLTDAVKEALHLNQFLKELGFNIRTPIILFNDNQGAAQLSKNPVHHARSKHIDIRCHFIREAISDGTVDIKYLPTERMPADMLTKAIPSSKLWIAVIPSVSARLIFPLCNPTM